MNLVNPALLGKADLVSESGSKFPSSSVGSNIVITDHEAWQKPVRPWPMIMCSFKLSSKKDKALGENILRTRRDGVKWIK